MSAKKRTHCIRGHELKPGNLYYGANGRQCRTCCLENTRLRGKQKTLKKHQEAR